MNLQKFVKVPTVLAVIFCLLLFPLLGSYAVHLGSLIAIMIIITLGLHIFYGLCGQIHFGMSGGYALGGYTCALLIREAGLHFFLALPITLFISLFLIIILGTGFLRLRHFVLALGTAAFAFAVWLSARTVAVGTLGGDDGLDIPPLILFNKEMGSVFYYYFNLFWMVICFFGAHFLGESRFGRAMKAIRENEVAASSMGINVSKYILISFILCNLYAVLAGILYAQWNGWISPASFSLQIGLMVLAAIVVGGIGHSSGAVVGTIIFMLLPQLLVPIKENTFLIQAIILFLIVRFIPKGIMGIIKDSSFRRGLLRMN